MVSFCLLGLLKINFIEIKTKTTLKDNLTKPRRGDIMVA